MIFLCKGDILQGWYFYIRVAFDKSGIWYSIYTHGWHLARMIFLCKGVTLQEWQSTQRYSHVERVAFHKISISQEWYLARMSFLPKSVICKELHFYSRVSLFGVAFLPKDVIW
ncbi:hypothetical protein CEXT_695581 [Caerostris extrusa]|uniref:Uncharacterized protein n=1 Tax=Caerostris extrusa TaxID=172846 RepID=A0AAV4VQV9_CAEEX|nr:hypothetical protein CEXT_695581 [Caerostris extrusa]